MTTSLNDFACNRLSRRSNITLSIEGLKLARESGSVPFDIAITCVFASVSWRLSSYFTEAVGSAEAATIDNEPLYVSHSSHRAAAVLSRRSGIVAGCWLEGDRGQRRLSSRSRVSNRPPLQLGVRRREDIRPYCRSGQDGENFRSPRQSYGGGLAATASTSRERAADGNENGERELPERAGRRTVTSAGHREWLRGYRDGRQPTSSVCTALARLSICLAPCIVLPCLQLDNPFWAGTSAAIVCQHEARGLAALGDGSE